MSVILHEGRGLRPRVYSEGDRRRIVSGFNSAVDSIVDANRKPRKWTTRKLPGLTFRYIREERLPHDRRFIIEGVGGLAFLFERKGMESIRWSAYFTSVEDKQRVFTEMFPTERAAQLIPIIRMEMGGLDPQSFSLLAREIVKLNPTQEAMVARKSSRVSAHA